MSDPARTPTTITFVMGATGCGKTAVAVSLARALQRQDQRAKRITNGKPRFICVINCDVLQFYQGLPVATNKASPDELTFADGAPIPHYFMSFLTPHGKRYSEGEASPTTSYENIVQSSDAPSPSSAANSSMYHIHDYVREVEAFLYGTVFPQHAADVAGLTSSGTESGGSVDPDAGGCSVIVCGGSHYYAQSLLFEGGMVSEDATNTSDSTTLTVPSTTATAEARWGVLNTLDPKAASQVHPRNTRRVERLIELAQMGLKPSDVFAAQQADGRQVSDSTVGAKSLLKFFAPRPLLPPTHKDATVRPLLCVLWIDAERQWLQERLDLRVDDMMSRGMLAEVQQLGKWVSSCLGPDVGIAGGTKRPRDECDNIDPAAALSASNSTLLTAIGFKEWMPLLSRLDTINHSDKGYQAALDVCVASVKQATRRYAKQQVQWIRNRFLGVYKAHWLQQRAQPLSGPVTAVPFLRFAMDECLALKPGGVSTQAYIDECVDRDIICHVTAHDAMTTSMRHFPVYLVDVLRSDAASTSRSDDVDHRRSTQESTVDRKTLHTCELCDMIVSGEEQWSIHLTSKRHKGALRHQALVAQQRALGREIPPRGTKRSQK